MSPLADAVLRLSAVLAVGLALRLALRGRSPALRHAVLAAAIVAAPIVAVVGATVDGLPILPRPTGGLTGGRIATTLSKGLAAVGATDADAVTATGAVAGTAVGPMAPARPNWTPVVAAAWIAGAAASLAWLLAAAVRMRRLARESVDVVDPRWRGALDRASDEAGLAQPIRLLVTPRGLLLATWGWRRPQILIPACALDWQDDRVRTVLAHEVAHIARRDWLVQLSAESLRALLWWNPLAWLTCRALRHDSELACDDAVLRAGVGATTYAEDLLQIARIVAPARLPVAAMRMARVSTLERRIVAMLNPGLDRRPPTRRALWGVALGLALLVLPVAVLRAAQAGRQPLDGVVYDASGAVMPAVEVTLDAGANERRTTTDPAGKFRFDGVEPGAHALRVEVPGFRALRQPLQLRKEGDWLRAVTLQIGDLKETISVSAARPATLTPIDQAEAGPKPIRVGGNIRAPRKVTNVNPVYPKRMLDAGLEGTVEIEAVIGVDGRVIRARPATGQAHPDFAAAAIEAVRQWRFEPTLLNGAPVEVAMGVNVDFSLQ
jgi:TonB family protein